MSISIRLFFLVLMVILSGGVGAGEQEHGYLHTGYGSVWRDSQEQCVWTTYCVVDVPECGAVAEEVTNVPVPAELKVVMEVVVQFDFDRSELKIPARAALDRLIDGLMSHDVRRIEIAGHTCNIGTEAYNQGLSERRAAAVRSYLVKRGVDGERIVTRGFGELRPAFTNDTRAHRASNRRAETRVFALTVE